MTIIEMLSFILKFLLFRLDSFYSVYKLGLGQDCNM